MLAAITQVRIIADHFLSMFIANTAFGLIGRDGIASIFIKRIRVSGTPQLRAALVDDAHNAADRLNEPGPICQDSKKRRPFADEYACLGMHSLRLRFRKKYTPGSQFWHKNRDVPRGMRGSGSVFGSPEYATWGFLLARGCQPATTSQAEAPSVGYLGFLARISCSRRSFCERKQGTYLISGKTGKHVARVRGNCLS